MIDIKKLEDKELVSRIQEALVICQGLRLFLVKLEEDLKMSEVPLFRVNYESTIQYTKILLEKYQKVANIPLFQNSEGEYIPVRKPRFMA